MQTNIKAIFKLKETIKMGEVGYFVFVMMDIQSLNILKYKKLFKWPVNYSQCENRSKWFPNQLEIAVLITIFKASASLVSKPY